MFEEDDSPAEAATGFADRFVEAGVAKLDALFGAGYAKQNPQALAAYIAKGIELEDKIQPGDTITISGRFF